MKLILSVTEGPHQGKVFTFDGHDTFLVGRVNDAHLQLSFDDPYFSRRHFVLEVNPPRCSLMDFKSRNGTFVNGERVTVAEIADGDVIKAGHTVFEVAMQVDAPDPEKQITLVTSESIRPPRTEMHKLPNPTLAGYELLRELGSGAMGVVYQAQRIADGKLVALKTIIPSESASEKEIERFIREAKILEELKHPNIIGFEEIGTDGDVVFLVMELVTGPDVCKILEERRFLVPKTAVRIVCQMLEGLHHAHRKNFVHRDIKPSNMLIHQTDGKKLTKLADFGLARACETSKMSGVTMMGDIGGTPAFMAPEQITHFRKVKPAADQYSSAATLYNLLTGYFVYDFVGNSRDALLKISTEDPVPIRQRKKEIPAELAKVIHKALSRDPKARYEDVSEFRKALLPFGS